MMSTGMTAIATRAGATARLMKSPLKDAKAKRMHVTNTNLGPGSLETLETDQKKHGKSPCSIGKSSISI